MKENPDNCVDCQFFSRGFLSEPDECSWFSQQGFNVLEKGTPIWCPLKYKGVDSYKIIQLFWMIFSQSDHKSWRTYPDEYKPKEEVLLKYVSRAFSPCSIEGKRFLAALKENTGEKLSEFIDEFTVAMKTKA